MSHPKGAPRPLGNSGHAAVCLGYQQLLVTGGLTERREVLSNSWVLDIQSERWREVSGILPVDKLGLIDSWSTERVQTAIYPTDPSFMATGWSNGQSTQLACIINGLTAFLEWAAAPCKSHRSLRTC